MGDGLLGAIRDRKVGLKKRSTESTQEQKDAQAREKEETKRADLAQREKRWDLFLNSMVLSMVPKRQQYQSFAQLGVTQELRDVLGRGKWAVVYKAPARRQRTLVFKVAQFSGNNVRGGGDTLPPVKFIEEYEREIEVLTTLKHQNIVRFEGVLLPPTVPFGIVQEYMNGGSLGQAMQSPLWTLEQVPEAQRMCILNDIVRGMTFMHRGGYIHRDIKPFNILLCSEECYTMHDGDNEFSPQAVQIDEDEGNPRNWIRAKIADFGTAAALDDKQGKKTLSEEVGTTGYTAPDIFSGAYGFPIDVFSLAVVMWELFSDDRKNPMTGKTEDRILAENIRPALGAKTPSVVTVLTKKGWDAEPTKRPNLQAIAGLLQLKV